MLESAKKPAFLWPVELLEIGKVIEVANDRFYIELWVRRAPEPLAAASRRFPLPPR